MVVRNLARRPFRAAASIVGIGFAVAVLMVGLVFIYAMERLIVTQFWVTERQDVTVAFVEPRSAGAGHALARLRGVLVVEPQRVVAGAHPLRPPRTLARHHRRRRRLRVCGASLTRRASAPLAAGRRRAVSNARRRAGGRPWRQRRLEVLEGVRPVSRVRVADVVDDVLGLFVYMDVAALHAMMREGDGRVGRAVTRGLESSAEHRA